MKFSFTDYKTHKTKSYLKKNSIIFFLNGINTDSSNWTLIEQNLKSMNFNYYKVFNKIVHKVLHNSIFINFKSTINGITFLITPNNKFNPLLKKILTKNFKPLLFNFLIIKLNNKIYQNKQLSNNLNSLNYTKNKLILFKFMVANTKIALKKSK